jgi:hypothetical protein
MFLENVGKSVLAYSVTSQNIASFVTIVSVTTKFSSAGIKLKLVIEVKVNICYPNPYLKGKQYIKDVKFKIFFLNGLLGDPISSTREGIINILYLY